MFLVLCVCSYSLSYHWSLVVSCVYQHKDSYLSAHKEKLSGKMQEWWDYLREKAKKSETQVKIFLLSVNTWESVYVRIFICLFMITSNTILATILIMIGEGVDLKLFVKAANGKFQALNLRLDCLWSPFRSRSRRQSTSEEEDEEYLDARSHGRRWRGKPRIDNHLGSIKMTIPTFQGKNDPELYLEWERKVNMCLIAIIILRRKRLN